MLSEWIASVPREEKVMGGMGRKASYRSILAGTYPPPPMAIMRLG